MKALNLTIFAGEVYQENNKHGCPFENIGQGDPFWQANGRGISAYVWNFYDHMCASHIMMPHIMMSTTMKNDGQFMIT